MTSEAVHTTRDTFDSSLAGNTHIPGPIKGSGDSVCERTYPLDRFRRTLNELGAWKVGLSVTWAVVFDRGLHFSRLLSPYPCCCSWMDNEEPRI